MGAWYLATYPAGLHETPPSVVMTVNLPQKYIAPFGPDFDILHERVAAAVEVRAHVIPGGSGGVPVKRIAPDPPGQMLVQLVPT